jgi:crotonobetainyl-CoA:carnitine CoA-transferase CaiB-like acyl-CoA transferase
MAALLSRQQTGKGVWIDCNLFETQVRGPHVRRNAEAHTYKV